VVAKEERVRAWKRSNRRFTYAYGQLGRELPPACFDMEHPGCGDAWRQWTLTEDLLEAGVTERDCVPQLVGVIVRCKMASETAARSVPMPLLWLTPCPVMETVSSW
jgi:hypothetical protein